MDKPLRSKYHPLTLFYFSFWFIYFSWFWFNLFQFNTQGDLTVGQANIWADWALHFTLGNRMAFHELIPSTSPLLINTDFSYPFVVNLISALLIRSGLDMLPAFILPSFFFSLLLVFSLYYFFYHLFKQPVVNEPGVNKPIVAVIACFIFFFNGGIGFYYFLQESIASGDILNAFLNPAKELTHINSEQIKWMSVLNSLFLPQRSLMMGFPLTLLALTQIFKFFQLNHPSILSQQLHTGKLFIPAIILGFMPIIHLHSFFVAFVILVCWMLSDLFKAAVTNRYIRFKYWLGLAIMVSFIALPILYIFYFSHISSQHFSWHPGWMAKDFNLNWFVFWFKNWTIVPLLAIFGWIFYVMKHASAQRLSLILLFLPFFLLFALVNLILLQPWVWDNTKILVWVSVGFSGLSAYLLNYLLSKHSQIRISLTNTGISTFIKYKILENTKRIIFSLLFLSIIISGLIDAYRNVRMDLHRHTLYTQKELNLAHWVKNNTEADSIWLVSPRHNHWLFNLTGRQSLFTYSGWLWSHGINYQTIENDMKKMFKTANANILKKYHVNYVILDSYTKQQLKTQKLRFIFQYPLIKKLGQYEIYKIQ